MKVYAVDAAMLFLAVQTASVLKDGRATEAAIETAYEVEEDEGTESNDNLVECQTVEPKWELSEAETSILLKIAMAEAEGEGVQGKALVMLVVMNRVESEEFPDSVSKVVFQTGQFSPVQDGGRYWDAEPDQECYRALHMIQYEGWDKSEGALYFCATGSSDWMEDNTKLLYTAGGHTFYK